MQRCAGALVGRAGALLRPLHSAGCKVLLAGLEGPSLPARCRAGIQREAVWLLLLCNGSSSFCGTLLVILKLLPPRLCPKGQPRHSVVMYVPCPGRHLSS